MNSLEMKFDMSEKKYEEARKISQDRLKKTVEAEAKIVHLSHALQRYVFHGRTDVHAPVY